ERRGTYANICTPVEIFPDAARYIDLHVDVVKHADGRIERVDDDELDDAVSAGHVSETLAAPARAVATTLQNALRGASSRIRSTERFAVGDRSAPHVSGFLYQTRPARAGPNEPHGGLGVEASGQ